jgi:hypothetical protein
MFLPLFCATAVSARSQTGNDDFQQAVVAYQQSPNDLNKAEKVIRMAAAMDQLPPIPEEARRHFVRGTALFKDAKTTDDYEQVGGEFKQAVHLAPWWPEARYNWALEQEAGGVYDWAIKNMKLYLLFKLSESDARAAQDKIYVLEAKQEKAAKAKANESSTQAAAVTAENSFDALLRKIDGRRYLASEDSHIASAIDIRGRNLVLGAVVSPGAPVSPGYQMGFHELERTNSRFEIRDREFSGPVGETLGCQVCPIERTFTISEDGERITQRVRFSDGNVHEDIYLWQR